MGGIGALLKGTSTGVKGERPPRQRPVHTSNLLVNWWPASPQAIPNFHPKIWVLFDWFLLLNLLQNTDLEMSTLIKTHNSNDI